MPKNSLILLHAPSVLDFRERPALWGPMSDLVPSEPIFDMYPIGFATIAEYLEKHGHRVRIVNLAVRMQLDPDFNVDKFVGSLNPSSFGIDLHWLPHANGSLELAHRIKRIHPGTPVIFGGISSSYFHEELIKLPQVDYVMRGDSTEEPLRQLIESIETGQKTRDLQKIPNLTWKDEKGFPQINPLSYIPDDLNYITVDYSHQVRNVIRDMNLKNVLPFTDWLKYPITAVLTCRGCAQNCAICGGSEYAFRHFMGRRKPAFRDPDNLAADIRRIGRFSRGPVFVLGDIRQAGPAYTHKFLKALQGISQQLIIEFFRPVDREFIEMVAGAVPGFTAQLSIESHDPVIRRFSNKPFGTGSLKSSIKNILAAGCRRLDVFFMSGMPGQTSASVLESIEYSRDLLRTVEGDPRLKFYISPLAPFLDPGSLAYENPEQYGYKKYCHNLEDHRKILLAPTWKYMLSYETRWMTRSEIVSSTYRAALLLNEYKKEFGQVSLDTAQATGERIRRAIDLMGRIDRLMAVHGPAELNRVLLKLKPEIDEVNKSTVCEKEDLNLPGSGIPVKVLKSTGLVVEESVKRLWKTFTT